MSNQKQLTFFLFFICFIILISFIISLVYNYIVYLSYIKINYNNKTELINNKNITYIINDKHNISNISNIIFDITLYDNNITFKLNNILLKEYHDKINVIKIKSLPIDYSNVKLLTNRILISNGNWKKEFYMPNVSLYDDNEIFFIDVLSTYNIIICKNSTNLFSNLILKSKSYSTFVLMLKKWFYIGTFDL